MIKAQLIDLGRNKVNKTVEVRTENALEKEIGKHIMSKHWEMEKEGADTWVITAGFRQVGTVKILSHS